LDVILVEAPVLPVLSKTISSTLQMLAIQELYSVENLMKSGSPLI